MLISRRSGRLVLVTHPDHAAVAGALAEAWGNSRFAAPARAGAFQVVARRHDDGWRTLDGEPHHNAEAGRPSHFLEVPLETSAAHYGPGVDGIHRDDAYAGVLASMHWAGLYSARWGLQPGGPLDLPLTREVVAVQQRRWSEALGRLWDGGRPRSEFEAQVWFAYELLQAVDLLSLALCTVDATVPTNPGADPVLVTATLPTIDQPPGPRIVPAVPLAAGGERCDLTVRVTEPEVVTVDPSPLRADVALAIPVRELPDRRYASARESAAAYADAPVGELSCVVST